MKNSQRGFIGQLLLVIIGVLIVAGGFLYLNKKTEAPISLDNQNSSIQSTNNVTTKNSVPLNSPVSEASPTPNGETPSTAKPPAPAPVPTPTQPQKTNPLLDVFIMQDDGTLIDPGNNVDLAVVAKKFYSSYPNQNYYDFLNISTTFSTQVANHLSFKFFPNYDTAGLPKKPLGFNFLGDTFTSSYVKTERELRVNLWVLIHETGHEWIVNNVGLEEGFGDGGLHYTKWADTGFVRDGVQWGDVMGGWPWKDNGDGTLTVNNINKVGFSKLSLYLMGLIPASEVPDLRIVVPENPQDQAFQNVRGKFKIISISDIIAKYGERTPSYQNSQKDFKMAFILLTKKGESPAPYQIGNINFIAKEFPREWNFVTYGKSTINQQ